MNSSRGSNQQMEQTTLLFGNLGMVWLLNALVPYAGLGVMSASRSAWCMPLLIVCWILEAKSPQKYTLLSMFFFYSIVGTIIVAVRHISDLSRAETVVGKSAAHLPGGSSGTRATLLDSPAPNSLTDSASNQVFLTDANAPLEKIILEQIHSNDHEPIPLRASFPHVDHSSHIHFADSSPALPTLEAKLRRAEREMSQNVIQNVSSEVTPHADRPQNVDLTFEPSGNEPPAQSSSIVSGSALSFQPAAEKIDEASDVARSVEDKTSFDSATKSGAESELPSDAVLFEKKISDSNQAIVDKCGEPSLSVGESGEHRFSMGRSGFERGRVCAGETLSRRPICSAPM